MFAQQIADRRNCAAVNRWKYLTQFVVNVPLSRGAVALSPLAIVLREQDVHLFDRRAQLPARGRWRNAPKRLHHLVHIPQFVKGGPIPISATPAGARRQPDGESLSEVFVGVLLCVRPAILVVDQVAHERPAERVRPKMVAVRLGERPERLDPLGFLVQAVSIIDGVTGFVTQKRHDALTILDLASLLLFNASETLVEEIKGHADDR